MSTCLSRKMAEALSDSEPSPSCSRGRPASEIDPNEVEFLLSKGFSKSKIAVILQVSRQTLYNRSYTWEPARFQKYSTISDTDLDLKVQQIKSTHPNDGEVMLTGHLLSQGIKVPRSKLRASIHCIDPEGTAERRSTAVRRRAYHVEGANYVWHIDGNHKLIRWRMVVHGSIDGFSWLITFLRCHTDNRSGSVLSAFMSGVAKYGLPRAVRTDHSGENIEVWRFMMDEHSSDKCIITGSSTHNERIERLWRDVHRSVIVTFADTFCQLEADSHLDPLNEVDIYCLHTVYVPRINRCLELFTAAWNNHPISTEHNCTPEQLFLTSISETHLHDSDSDSTSSVETGSDIDNLPANDAVPVPQCSFQPCTQLQRNIDETLRRCVDDAKTRYHAIIDICGQHLIGNCTDCNELN